MCWHHSSLVDSAPPGEINDFGDVLISAHRQVLRLTELQRQRFILVWALVNAVSSVWTTPLSD